MVPMALNLELEKLLSTSARERRLPLAVERFMNEIGSLQPEAAMHQAATRVLSSYAASLTARDSPHLAAFQALEDPPYALPFPVSVARLCSVTDVDLIGVPVRQERSLNRSDYGAFPYPEHTATVEFTRPRPIIRLPDNISWNRGRVAAAHEIGHVLIHKRDHDYDQATIRLGSTPAEEALAEYAARLLLLPGDVQRQCLREIGDDNCAVQCVKMSQRAQVTIHASVARLGDPDTEKREIRGAIFWRMLNNRADGEIEELLTPYWHLCPRAYIPVGKCKARKGSLIADLAADTARVAGSRIEQVEIGTLTGAFLIDAFAWGSIADRTRVVLSVFRCET
jgi:Zn-dependent peptidase ImmA (M78 family)